MRPILALTIVLLWWPTAAAYAQDAGEHRDPQAVREYRHGTELGQHGDHAGAIAAYQTALQLEPKWLDARNDLGVEYYLTGDPRRAVAELRAVLDADPKRGVARANLAFALYDLGRIDEAVAEWQAALEQGARVADTYAGLALGLFKQGKMQEAVRTYRTAVERDRQYARFGYLESGGAGWSRRAVSDAAVLLGAVEADQPRPPATAAP